jgi:hypothetical protein
MPESNNLTSLCRNKSKYFYSGRIITWRASLPVLEYCIVTTKIFKKNNKILIFLALSLWTPFYGTASEKKRHH